MVKSMWGGKPLVDLSGGRKSGSGMTLFGSQKAEKRTLSKRDHEILWKRAGKKCENCGKSLEEEGEMQAGHKQAASKGGKAILSNSVSLCYSCNRLQGTDSWETFRKKQGKPVIPTATGGKKRSPSTKKHKRKSSKQTNYLGGAMFGSMPKRGRNPFGL